MKNDNTIYLFREHGLGKWAFRWNQHTFWTNLSTKVLAPTAFQIVQTMNPQYTIFLED